MKHLKRTVFAGLLMGSLLTSQVQAGDCGWDPYSGQFGVDQEVPISAYSLSGPPDRKEFCDCDEDDNPVNWEPTGNAPVGFSGDVIGPNLNTETPGMKTVTAYLAYEYSCSVTGAVRLKEDEDNPFDNTYTVEVYWIEGPSWVGKNSPQTYTVKSASGGPVTVNSWDASGGTVVPSEQSAEVSWSDDGTKELSASIDGPWNPYTNVEVIGDLQVSISSPADPTVAAKNEGVNFSAADPVGGSGNYTYEWDFTNGKTLDGNRKKKNVSGVTFEEGEGTINEVKLLVKDTVTGNSGTAAMNVIVPKITLSSKPLHNLGISAKSNWPLQPSVMHDAHIIATLLPDDNNSVQAMKDSFVVEVKQLSGGAAYTPEGKGSCTRLAEKDSGNKIYWKYEAFVEPKSEKHPLEKTAELVAKIGSVESSNVLNMHVRTVFRNLVILHQHGPEGTRHSSDESDYELAAKYVLWKYGISLDPRASVSFSFSMENNAETDASGSIVMGAIAFEKSENWCVSVLLHENVHVAQPAEYFSYVFLTEHWYNPLGPKDYYKIVEKPCYIWQLATANEVGLSEAEIADITGCIERINEGLTPLMN
jgi:hypothetical protein